MESAPGLPCPAIGAPPRSRPGGPPARAAAGQRKHVRRRRPAAAPCQRPVALPAADARVCVSGDGEPALGGAACPSSSAGTRAGTARCATAPRRMRTAGCSNGLGTWLGGTCTRSPSAGTAAHEADGDAYGSDAVLEVRSILCEASAGPREVVAPERLSLGVELDTLLRGASLCTTDPAPRAYPELEALSFRAGTGRHAPGSEPGRPRRPTNYPPHGVAAPRPGLRTRETEQETRRPDSRGGFAPGGEVTK
jgi:hypothetical protein